MRWGKGERGEKRELGLGDPPRELMMTVSIWDGGSGTRNEREERDRLGKRKRFVLSPFELRQ